jgi:hypothetical protein
LRGPNPYMSSSLHERWCCLFVDYPSGILIEIKELGPKTYHYVLGSLHNGDLRGDAMLYWVDLG